MPVFPASNPLAIRDRAHRSCTARASRRTRGFTLIELLVVLTVIALLIGIVAPRVMQHADRATETALRQNLASLRSALDQYHADTGRWPASLDVLIDARYLRAAPLDPVTGRTDSWRPVLVAEGAHSGVYDVRSGAEGSASDGTRYADW